MVLKYWSMRIKAKLKQLIEDERGATALEYGLIATGIFLVIVLAVNLYASEMENMYNLIANTIAGEL